MSSVTKSSHHSKAKSNSSPNPSTSCTTAAASAPTSSESPLTHEECVWPFYLCIDDHAKTFICIECHQIPQTGHAFTNESGYIFCEYCIDRLIHTQIGCKMDQQRVQHKNAAKVIDNLVRNLRMRCPHCKQSQLHHDLGSSGAVPTIGGGGGDGDRSQELKRDEIDDDDEREDDANAINMPVAAFPIATSQASHSNMLMNEGVNDNHDVRAQKPNVYFCDWIGTVHELSRHLKNDCKFIKIDCPLQALDARLCDVQNLYQHQMKSHLEECSVTHWQHLVAQINELKSMQLSLALKQQEQQLLPALQLQLQPSAQQESQESDGEMERGVELLSTTQQTQTPTPDVNVLLVQDAIQNHSEQLLKLNAEHAEFKQSMLQTVQELSDAMKVKDAQIADLGRRLSLMQVGQSTRSKEQERRQFVDMFHHDNHTHNNSSTSNAGHEKLTEMQHMLLQTQNKLDSMAHEMQHKTNIIESQHKSISSLQSRMTSLNVTASTGSQASHSQSSLTSLPPTVIPGAPTHHVRPISPGAHSSPHGHGHGHGHSLQRVHSFDSSEHAVHHAAPYATPTGHHSPSHPHPSHHPPHRYGHQPHYHAYAPHSQQQHHPHQPRTPDIPEEYDHHTWTATSMHHGDGGSKSLNQIQLHDSEKIYRSDSGGSMEHHKHGNDNDTTHFIPPSQSHAVKLSHSLPPPPHLKTRGPKSRKRKRDIHHQHQHRDIHPPSTTNTMDKTRLVLYAVGYNEGGELGVGHRSNLSQFTRLPFCDRLDIVGVYYGSQSFFYQTRSNELYAVGYNLYGQLGLGHCTEYIIKPTLNKYLSSDEKQIAFISTSVCAYHTILKTSNGSLYGYGWNTNGQLGIGHKSSKECIPVELSAALFNTRGQYGAYAVVEVACGFHHSLFLCDDGRVICVGSNQFGQLGFGSNVNEMMSPSFIDDECLTRIVGVQCGEYFSAVLDADGAVFVFGRNDSGQLGLGNAVKSEQCVYAPERVVALQRARVRVGKLRCGDGHALCLSATGSVYAWGNNEYGQIGCEEQKHESGVNVPMRCRLPKRNHEKTQTSNNSKTVIIDIDVGAYHSLLLSEDNDIFSFGNNDCNQCSTLLTHKKLTSPYLLKKGSEIKFCQANEYDIAQVIAGYDCSFLVKHL